MGQLVEYYAEWFKYKKDSLDVLSGLLSKKELDDLLRKPDVTCVYYRDLSTGEKVERSELRVLWKLQYEKGRQQKNSDKK